MYLDRQLQLSILESLREKYPDPRGVQALPEYRSGAKFRINLFYLHEHDLLRDVDRKDITPADFGNVRRLVRITAKGLDFLEDDGGIGAMLGKVIVKFDENDLASLLDAIDRSDAPEEDKGKVKTMLKALPAESLKTVYTRLLNLAMDNAPDAFHLMQKLLGST